MVVQNKRPFSQTKIDTIKICLKITIKRFIYIHIDDRVWSIIGLIHILIFISNHKFLEGWAVELLILYAYHFTQEYSHRHSIHYNFHKSGRRSTQIDHHKKFKSKIYIQPNLLFIDVQVLYKTSTSIFQVCNIVVWCIEFLFIWSK